MIDKRTEQRLVDFCLWFLAGVILLIILTSCNPYVTAPSATPMEMHPARSTIAPAPQSSRIPIATQTPSPTCTVRTGIPAGTVNLRTGADVSHAVVRVLSEGEILKVLERADWMKVSDERGNRGYINARYCK